MGVKVFEFLRRKEGTTPAQFHARWRQHAAMLADDPTLRRHVNRYELNHRLLADAERDRAAGEVDDTGWDGVAVLWFDSEDALSALRDEPGMAAVRSDAPQFRDDQRLMVTTNDPDVIVSTPRRDDAGAKMLCILRRNAALDLDTFHEHWLTHHGGLFQTIPELTEPLWGYDQNHGLRDPDAAFDGVTEQWFESLDSFVQSIAVPAHSEIVSADVAYMLDPASIHFVMAGRPTLVIG